MYLSLTKLHYSLNIKKENIPRWMFSFHFIWKLKNYYFLFPASNCSFKAAKASISPSVVEAAWF